jgi:FixJ family two-component response regulator
MTMTISGVVLVVDDEADLAESCARLLGRHGYHVVTAGCRAAGQAALAGTSPALLGAAGAVAFLSKPFSNDVFARTVEKALERPYA